MYFHINTFTSCLNDPFLIDELAKKSSFFKNLTNVIYILSEKNRKLDEV